MEIGVFKWGVVLSIGVAVVELSEVGMDVMGPA